MTKSYSIDKKIEISDQLQIGTKERILLVKANGKSFLIGATPQAINTLHVFEQTKTDEHISLQDTEKRKVSPLGKAVHG
jgi:flagellar biogenesis protein FliO